MQKLLNNYVKIDPIEIDEFLKSDKSTYEEMGIVVDKAENLEIPIGSIVYFDSYMAKKYSNPQNKKKFQWFIQYDEIVAYDEPTI